MPDDCGACGVDCRVVSEYCYRQRYAGRGGKSYSAWISSKPRAATVDSGQRPAVRADRFGRASAVVVGLRSPACRRGGGTFGSSCTRGMVFREALASEVLGRAPQLRREKCLTKIRKARKEEGRVLTV